MRHRRTLASVGRPSDRVSVITLRSWGFHPFGPPDDDPTPVTVRTIERWLSNAISNDPTGYITLERRGGIRVADAHYFFQGCPNTFRVAFTDSYTPELKVN